MVLEAAEGYRLLAADYDREPNALIAVEERVLREAIEPLSGRLVVDFGTGTGRWMEYAASRGARAIGLDLSSEMLRIAAMKRCARGRLVHSSILSAPVMSNAADLALCSFALGYVPAPEVLFAEMARVAPRVVVSDMHPTAIAEGWERTFRTASGTIEIRQHAHTVRDIDDAAAAAGLDRIWRIEARFGECERGFFERAGKLGLFERVRRVPALMATCWVRRE